ncbi:hypothetical protein KKI90_17755 [Xenorhabdus bovienii]|uniref:Uncharacterized protein n=2 Tax=Xenorhabdus bovienii TaxID=40576 RepID=A0A077PWI4_XENBV|nr:hypothetical protein [Xenorhabdus bovienii]MDE1488126.1 hypothetical protein [Xenorhabdus bovienii]MDE9479016.1 hypothetical protein [Xenorhabdus bovienii]CDH02778.1 conserved hypothetical protein [Xenorhabdus bovienii str. feltiae Moldova]CDH25046.1 conserved hypothetical protein [Xenorhabdus bovienii str. kraussei Becker Underwood]
MKVRYKDIGHDVPRTTQEKMDDWLNSNKDQIQIINIETLMRIEERGRLGYLKPDYK